MPTIQNQIGILPSKYCTATIAGRPTALTMMERRNGTRRYSTAMYTMHAAHSQMAVYERGMSGKVWVTGTVDGTDAANTCTMCAAFVHLRYSRYLRYMRCLRSPDHLPPPM